MYTSCLLFFVSISEAEDETSDTVTVVAAGSGRVLLLFSSLAAGPELLTTISYVGFSKPTISADILAISQAYFYESSVLKSVRKNKYVIYCVPYSSAYPFRVLDTLNS
jgi:hypothetical protein